MIDSESRDRIKTYCLMAITSAIIIFMVYWLRPVLVPFVVAIFVVSGITPVLQVLEQRLRVSRLAATGLTFLFGLLSLFVLGTAIWTSLVDLAYNSGSYRQRIQELVMTVESWIPDKPMSLLFLEPTHSENRAGAEVELENSPGFDRSQSGRQQDTADRLDSADAAPADADVTPPDPAGVIVEEEDAGEPDELTDAAALLDASELDVDVLERGEDAAIANELAGQPTVDGLAETMFADPSIQRNDDLPPDAFELLDTFIRRGITITAQTLLTLVSTGVVVLIYVFFLLLGSVEQLRPGATFRSVERKIRSYIAVKTLISLATGAAFGAVLWLFGVPMAVTFGVLGFLLNFIPSVGPIVASLLPVPFVVLQPDAGVTWMVAVLVLSSGVQFVSGSIIEPKLMGDSSDLHPVMILFALMFWGMMWGIIGMFLAVPITSGIKIVLERFETTKSIAAIMAGRFPEDFGGDGDKPR